MKCVYCLQKKTEVANSREIKGGLITWRRRYCPSCKKVFTTKESAMADNLFVLKRNGSRQRFVYEKLFVSIFTVINIGKNKDNGNDAKLAKKISQKIMKKLFAASLNKNIASKTIIELACAELKKTGAAYADRYISYSDYRIKIAASGFIIG